MTKAAACILTVMPEAHRVVYSRMKKYGCFWEKNTAHHPESQDSTDNGYHTPKVEYTHNYVINTKNLIHTSISLSLY
jgi:5'(3')-deoxyribonucleotidase